MGARTKARKRALDILFESELQGRAPGATLEDRRAQPDRPLNDYTVRLVEGVMTHLTEIDALLEAHAAGWSLARMPAVDRNIARIGVYELRYVEEVPPAVALSEAVGLAKDLSTDESPSFLNGLLAAVAGLAPVDLTQ